MTIDLFATMAALVSAPPPAPERPIDGRDARAVWRCEADAAPSQEVFLFYYHENRLEAVRAGRWKLCLPHRSRTLDGKPGGVDGGETPYVQKDVPQALYDLARDPRESIDVSADHPEVVAELMRAVDGARADLGDANVGAPGLNRRAPGRAGGA
jgi:arylsulfatase